MDPLLYWFLLSALFAIFIGIGAARRGRNGVAWFLLATAIGPIFGLIALMAASRRDPQRSPTTTGLVGVQVSSSNVAHHEVYRVDLGGSDAKRGDR